MNNTSFDPGNSNDIVARAFDIALENKNEYVTLEHLLLSLMEDKEIISFCDNNGINYKNIINETKEYIDKVLPHTTSNKPKETSSFIDVIKLSITDTLHRKVKVLKPLIILESILKNEESYATYFLESNGIDSLLIEEAKPDAIFDNIDLSEEEFSEQETFLRKYCVCLNDSVNQSKLNPLIGRQKEVDEVELILARKNKSNAILIGEAGVGKSAVVEGIAKQIVEGKASPSLKNAEIWSLDIGTLIAGTKYRGDMEERLKNIISAFTELNSEERVMIMFIDEIHTIMNAGGTSGSPLDVGNMLKPALARSAFKVIGATTSEEYRKHFEKDKALIRRFQKIQINEPSVKDTIDILTGLKSIYEEYHNVKFDKNAIIEAVELSNRYITNKFLPDKAIDIIDVAGAKAKLAQKENSKATKITKLMIEDVVSSIANIPVKTLKETETDKLKNLKVDLEKAVIGQDKAVNELTDAIILNRMGLREKGKPQGSYLMTGPTGVGKTHMVKQLANTLDMNLVRFDMSEYMEKYSVAKMIGAPPGYVGYSDGQAGSGILINKIKENPYSIIFLDEIEKAHPDVFNIFLQIMEDGRLTSSDGETVNFENTIIIMTSNAGARDMAQNTIGFGNASREGTDDVAIEKIFSPEFRNRLDAIIKFNSLTKENMSKIVDIELKNFIDQAKEQKIKVKVLQSAKKYLTDKGYDPKMGARPLKRLIQDEVKKPLSKAILFENKKEFSVECVDNKIVIV